MVFGPHVGKGRLAPAAQAAAGIAFAFALAFVAVSAARAAPPPPPAGEEADAWTASPLERDLRNLFSATVELDELVLHFRPGSLADSARTQAAEALREAYAALAGVLEARPARKVHVYLYDDARELARLTGRPASGGDAREIGGSIHLAVDRRPLAPARALARVFEAAWGDAGGYSCFGRVAGGPWYKLAVAARSGRVAVSVDGRKLFETGLKGDAAEGGIGFGVEEGVIALKNLKVRPAAPAGGGEEEWFLAIRPEVVGSWAFDAVGEWRIGEEGVLTGTRTGRWSRALFSRTTYRDFELEVDLRLTEGASAEVAFHVKGDRSNRILLTPGGLWFAAAGQGRVPCTGPNPFLREGLYEAAVEQAQEGTSGTMAGVGPDGRARPSLHTLARALLLRDLVAPIDGLRSGLATSGTERFRRRVLAGSLVLFLLDRHGLPKYRDLHYSDFAGSKTPLGEMKSIDEEWRRMLRAREPATPEDARRAERALALDLLAGAAGAGGGGAAGAGLRPLGTAADWRLDAPWRLVEADQAKRQEAVLVLEGASAPARAVAADEAGRVTVVLSFRYLPGGSLKLYLNEAGGKSNRLEVRPSGIDAVTSEGKTHATKEAGEAGDPDRFTELLVSSEGGAGRVYVDGQLVLDIAAGFASTRGRIAIEGVGRKVEVRGVKVL